MIKKSSIKILLFIALITGWGSRCLAMDSIAVLDFDNLASISSSDAIYLQNELNCISDYVIEELVKSNCYIVMDNPLIKNSIKEHDISLKDGLDIDTVKKIGNILGVRYLVMGDIFNIGVKSNTVQYENSRNSVKRGEIGVDTKTVEVTVVASIVDMNSGDIIAMVVGNGASTSSLTRLGINITDDNGYRYTNHLFKVGSEKVSQESLHNALKKAAVQIGTNIIKMKNEKHKPLKDKHSGPKQ